MAQVTSLDARQYGGRQHPDRDVGILAGSPVGFTATGTAGAATTGNSLITAAAGSFTAGGSVGITVQLKDSHNNNLAATGGSVTLSTTRGSLTTVTDNGNGTYSATLSSTSSGPATVTGTLNGSPITDNELVTVNVGTASAAITTISASPTSIVANGVATSTITVQAKDAQGNNLTTSGSTVTLTSSSTGALAVSPGPAGTGTYTATVPATTTAGVVTVSGTIDLGGGPVAITSGNATVTFTAGAATQYLVTSSSATPTAGSAVTITAHLADANGNFVSLAGRTVNWSSNGTGGSFVTPSSVTDASGTAVVTFTTSTSTGVVHTVTGTDNTAITGTSASITTAAGTFVKLQLLLPGETAAPGTGSGKTGTPSAQAAGTPFSVTVNAVDANWNVIASGTDNIHITSTDANAVLPANNTLSAGTRTFSVTFHTASPATITATDLTNGGITANTSPSVTVNPGAFVKLQALVPGETAAPGSATGKTGTPSARTAGSSFSVTVNAVDANWNLVTGATDNVHITSSDANATLPANNTLTGGTQTFSVTFKTAAPATITATDLTNGGITASTSPSITVNVGAFVKLQTLLPGETAAPGTATGKTGTPTNQQAGSGVTVTVNAVDANWNLVTAAPANTIGITSSDANAVLPANNTLSSGTRNFTVTFHTAAAQTVTASNITNPGITAGASASVTIDPGAYSQIQVLLPGETAAPGTATGKTGTPDDQASGTEFGGTVNAVDAFFNVVTTITEDVDITSVTDGAFISSNTPRTFAAGTATFLATFGTAGAQTVTATVTRRPRPAPARR